MFDIARYILNEFEDTHDERFTAKFKHITQTLAEKLRVPPSDLLKLVYVEMCMANSWCVESNENSNMLNVEFTKKMMNGKEQHMLNLEIVGRGATTTIYRDGRLSVYHNRAKGLCSGYDN